jgi:ubiquinone/menaquinone biosynthesis C-methylase UbiE
MMGIARRNAAQEGSRATFELAAVEELPFEEASFDAALLSLVLHHLPAEVKRSGLKEIGRVLRPGGRLIVVDLDRSDSVLWRIVLRPLSHVETSADAFEGKIPIYLREAGFESVTVEGRWWKSLTFWRAMKPLSSIASVETPAT